MYLNVQHCIVLHISKLIFTTLNMFINILHVRTSYIYTIAINVLLFQIIYTLFVGHSNVITKVIAYKFDYYKRVVEQHSWLSDTHFRSFSALIPGNLCFSNRAQAFSLYMYSITQILRTKRYTLINR